MSLPSTPFRLPSGSLTVSAAELRRNFGEWQERAFAAPVVVVRHGRPRLVLSSAEQFFGDKPAGPAPLLGSLHSALALVPEYSSEGLLVLDRELRIVAVNRVFEDMAAREGTMTGRLFVDAFAELAESALADHLRQVLRTGTSVRFETQAMMAEGRRYLATAFPHHDGVAVLFANHTSEFLMAEQVEEYRSLAAALGAISGASYLKVNLRGLVCGGSRQTMQLLGLDLKSAPQVPLQELVAEADRPQLLRLLDRVLTGAPPEEAMVSLLTSEGTSIPVQMVLATIWRGAAADGAVAAFRPAA